MSLPTIFAPATAPGRSGVAVIRVSGSAVRKIAITLTGKKNLTSRVAALVSFEHPVSRETIDKGLLLFFEGPNSYTGEDVAEFHLHGSPAVMKSMLEALSGFENARMAEPGEFTRRAFENNKMDLTGAEAVADLIDAETAAQKNQALVQLEGGLKSLYEDWSQSLKGHLAYLEAHIDFPDEDLPADLADSVAAQIKPLKLSIEEHLNDNRRGELVRDGVKIAILGAPNAGKSTLINRLAARNIALVSPTAGTTRDVIEAHLSINGYPVIFYDTAGIRDLDPANEHEALEKLGIERSQDIASKADLCLILSSANDDDQGFDLDDMNSSAPIINVINKVDQGAAREKDKDIYYISALNGEGVDVLLSGIEEHLSKILGVSEGPVITRARHRTALQAALQCLDQAMSQSDLELQAEDLRMAVREIGRITGRVDVEDLLDVIFNDFCIGK